MALPNMPSYYTTRKNIYEAAIVCRRTKENDFREKWGNTADYFHKENVAASKKKNWESDQSFHASMDAYKAGKDKEQKLINLKKRQLKLADLLQEERSQHLEEMKSVSPRHQLCLEDMKEKSEGLRSAREEKRKQVAQDLLYQHWRTNNPDMRQLEQNQHKQYVVDSWSEQQEERERIEAEERSERERLDREMEEERQRAVALEEQKRRERLQEQTQLKLTLKNQVDELKYREKEAVDLKKHEEQLQRSQWELGEFERRQKQMEEERKKLEFGRVLLRQHAAALKRKSKKIQEELEEDRQFLELLSSQEEAEQAIQSARKDKAKADATWMKKVIEEQIRVEKTREAELDMLYQDEAAQIWQKRENEWSKERQARERLMREVMASRQDQIDQKMEAVKHLQEESLREREELLEDLERVNQLTRRERDEEAELKSARKQEMEAQITARHEKEAVLRKQLEEDLAGDKKAEEDYDELLRQEAEQLNIRGFAPKNKMALPNMPSYYTTRKNIYEAAIVCRRTKENDFREKWGNTADYFHKENVAASKKKNWESDQSFHASMDAYKAGKDKEQKLINLKKRRLKLADLLQEERSQHLEEMKSVSPRHQLCLEDMKEKSEGLRSAREEKRKQVAQDLLYQHWRTNNPDMRQLEQNQHKPYVVDSWSEQQEERERIEAEERSERERLDREMEEERQRAVALEEQKRRERLQEQTQLKLTLKNQVDELKYREKEAVDLKKHEEQLQRSQWELGELERRQKQMEEERKKLEFGRVLLRQHAAALKRKSKKIQEELEEDRQFLELLSSQEEAEQAIQSARKDKAKADATWMKKVIEEQIRVEKTREAELDMLYQDEAAQIWQKRENEWSKERQARERLMREVMASRQDQIDQKMEAVKHLQEESLREREELLEDLERVNQLTRRERDEEAELKSARKQEMEAQITARHEKEAVLRKQLEEDLAGDKKAEEDYDELLRQEAEQLNIRGFAPKVHARKTAWM